MAARSRNWSVRWRVTVGAMAVVGAALAIGAAVTVWALATILRTQGSRPGGEGRGSEHIGEVVEVAGALLGVGVPLATALIGVVVWRVATRALAPVEQIRLQVEQVDADALDQRVPVSGTGDEIDRLAGTMNSMLDRIEHSYRSQQQFVSDASHELRSPLATMRQFAEVASRHPQSTTPEELSEVVLAEGGRMQEIVEGLLLLARLDEGEARSAEEVDLDDLALAEAKRLRSLGGVTVDSRGVTAVRVVGDARLLARAVRNLADNAVRHGRSQVAVSTTSENGVAVIRVDDDGAGVPEADRQRIFERFVRLDEARARDDGGSGLGLAIVAQIARAHGGTVRVEDSPLGGAQFTMELPEQGDVAPDPRLFLKSRSAPFRIGSAPTEQGWGMSDNKEQNSEVTQEIEVEETGIEEIEAVAEQGPIVAEDKPSFFKRRWVKITGAVLAGLALLGMGIGIGAEIGEHHEERAMYKSFEHETERGHGGRGEGRGDRGNSSTESPVAADAAALVAAIDMAVAEVDGTDAVAVEVERNGWEVEVLTADGKEVEVLVHTDGTVRVGRSKTAGSDPALDTTKVPAIIDAAIAAAGDGTVREISTSDSSTVSFEVAVRTSAGRTVEVELAQDLSVVSVDE